MQLPWKQFLLLCGVVTLLVDTAVAFHYHEACYGNLDSQMCSQHHLYCVGKSIFITEAVRGFKLNSSYCLTQCPQCQDGGCCCSYSSFDDCVETYSQEAFTALARECWNRETCAYSVQEANNEECGENYKPESGYSKVAYRCISASEIHKFTDSEPFTARYLVLRFLPSDAPGSYVCLVEGVSSDSAGTSVLLAKLGKNCSRSCSSLKVEGKPWLSCTQPRYATYSLSTPFTVRLHAVNENTNDEAWAVIDAYPGKVRVKCESETNDVSTPQCPFISTATRETTSAAAVSSPDETLPQSAENPGNTAALVGGVVGAVLVLLVVLVVLVALVVGVFFLKRRGGNSSRSHGNSGGVEPNVTYAQPTSLPVYYDSAVPFTVEAGVRDPDSDYNHLGQKPTSSASRDVTYGHLADGSDVTDYGYDHVTKGKPAARSGDVINNVYDTAGPATGVSIDEDFYNTTDAAQK